MKITVKEAIADILKNEGVEYAFGHTGSHIWKLCKTFEDEGLTYVLNRQEGNGVYMADGFTRISKIPSVVTGTLGPGVTNMATGAVIANMDSIPLILIGGTVTAEESGRNSMQESSGRGRSPEQRLIFKECCKSAMFAPSPEATPNMLREAFRIANSGRKGSVYIEIPDDYWDVEIDYQRIDPHQYQNKVLAQCDSELIKEISKVFHESKHPMIVIGEGAEEKDINEIFSDFIKKLSVPFAATPLAKNFVDEYHELYLGGMRGNGKTQRVYEYMKESDLILFLGARMHDPEMKWDDASLIEGKILIQVDFDSQEIGRVYPIDYSVVGSVSSFIRNFNCKKHKNNQVLNDDLKKIYEEFPRKSLYSERGLGIHPINIINTVEKHSSSNSVFVSDTGWVKGVCITKLRTKLNQSFVVSDKNGTMGYSIPAAIGASLASKKETICLVGDGGAQMSINELGTLLNYPTKVIFIIFDNKGCACMFDTGQASTQFKSPNFVKLAEAYDLKGFFVDNSADFEKAFIQVKKEKKSVIIHAKIDQDLMVWE